MTESRRAGSGSQIATSSAAVPTGSPGSGDVVLGLAGVKAYYEGGEEAIHGVDLELRQGEVVGLLGANGSGKTTTLRAISGLVRTVGLITFDGSPLVASPVGRARLGLAHVPEGRQVFATLSVAENLLLGHQRLRRHERDPTTFDRVLVLFPELQALLKRSAGWLSGGEQQMVAIGRALMAQPRVMLLDEPTMGLAPVVVDRLHGVFDPEMRAGLTVLIAEENFGFVAAVTDRTYVLRAGRVAWSGSARAIESDPTVRQMLLG